MTAEVKLGEKDVFSFLFYHTYFNIRGLLFLILEIGVLAMGISYFAERNWLGVSFAVISVFLFVTLLLLVKRSAGKLVSENPFYQRTTYFAFHEGTMQISQEEAGTASVELSDLNRIIKFRKIYFLYIDATRANILPVSALSVSEAEADAYFRKYIPKNRLRGIR